MEFGIEKCSMLVMKKWQTKSNRRNGNTKSRQNKNARREKNVQILGHLGGWHHQISGDEIKN